MRARSAREWGWLAISLLAFAAPPSSVQAADVKVLGKWALKMSDAPNKLRCFKVGSKLAQEITAAPYSCGDEGTPTGGKAISCSVSKDKVGYIVYESLSDCKEARDTVSTAE